MMLHQIKMLTQRRRGFGGHSFELTMLPGSVSEAGRAEVSHRVLQPFLPCFQDKHDALLNA